MLYVKWIGLDEKFSAVLRNKLIPMSNTPQDLLWGERDPVRYQAAQSEKIMKGWV